MEASPVHGKLFGSCWVSNSLVGRQRLRYTTEQMAFNLITLSAEHVPRPLVAVVIFATTYALQLEARVKGNERRVFYHVCYQILPEHA
jgi:hypothetical protein